MTKRTDEQYRGFSGRRLGNAKTSAKRLGVSLDEWIDRVGAGLRHCFRCRQWKTVADFSRDASRKDGRTHSCKACTSNASKCSIYGISNTNLIEMLSAPCEICGRTDRRIDVDHCHRTGIVRGGLCETCNRGLGLLGDTVESLQRALEYLKRSEKSNG